jgi:hypothetical protein
VPTHVRSRLFDCEWQTAQVLHAQLPSSALLTIAQRFSIVPAKLTQKRHGRVAVQALQHHGIIASASQHATSAQTIRTNARRDYNVATGVWRRHEL